jgi:hypothetical protein
MLMAYCAVVRRERITQRFLWEEGGLLDDHGRLLDPTIPESRDAKWRRLVADTLRAEGFVYTATDDGFTIACPPPLSNVSAS